VKQGVYQLDLLSGAEPIEQALRSSSLDQNRRKKLELILDVRAFASSHLKLSVHKNYKDVNLDWDQVIHTVSASEPLRFQPYLWWFPIIGSVPYKGFFNEKDADDEEKRVKAEGFETQKRRIQGYSTLGFFSDPVWPAMLLMSDQALVELIIHELAHATIYFSGQTPFNETFANFVGKVGARAYFAARFGKESAELKKLYSYNEINDRYYEFFHELFRDLDAVYKSDLPQKAKEDRKNEILKTAEKKYEILVTKDVLPKIDWSVINNAYLLSFKNYHHDNEIFESLLAVLHYDFGSFINEVRYYGHTATPFLSLRNRLQTLITKL
jgi:predicted aminopeptidase